MHKVSSILARKGTSVVSILPGTSVMDALKIMAEKNIGSIVVMENGLYLGIVTERDYSRKVALKGKHSIATTVEEIMSSDLPFVSPDDTLDYCMNLMSEKNIRYLPVFENNQLCGVVSISDVVKETIITQRETINQLESYIRS